MLTRGLIGPLPIRGPSMSHVVASHRYSGVLGQADGGRPLLRWRRRLRWHEIRLHGGEPRGVAARTSKESSFFFR